jgi:hypothetical protein
MATLHDILWDTNNDGLAFRLKLLGVKPLKPNKAEMTAAIKDAFMGNGLNIIWSSLSQLEKSAVAEACYASDLCHNETRFSAKYGNLPSFCNLPKDKQRYYYSWDAKFATRLNLLLFNTKSTRERFVPEDLAERLREFVPAPKALAVATLTEPLPEDGLYVRLTEHESLSEVITLLRLAEQGNLRISDKTGMPSAAGCKKILECLTGGDYFPPEITYVQDRKSYDQEIGPIKPVGWSRLLKNGRYINTTGTKSKLTPAGIKALSLDPHKVIRHLWDNWTSNTIYDEFNRVNEIKGQSSKGHMTAKPPRRRAILDALLECPVDKWVDLGKFSNFMQAGGFDFDVSNDPWKLYLCDKQYGSFGYDGYGEWSTMQFRYMLSLLFEHAATLGMIDIAYVHPSGALDDFRGQWGADDLSWLSRYDGLRAFRITHLGAYCLGMTEEFTPVQPVSLLKLEVLPNLSIRIVAGEPQPAEKFLLETWAESVSEDTWRLEPKRAREAVERGQGSADLTAFLSQCDDQPLPQTVEGFLKSCESDGKAVKSLGEAKLFECRDSNTVAVICNQAALKNTCFKIGESQLVVPSHHEAKFRKVVKSLGLGIV